MFSFLKRNTAEQVRNHVSQSYTLAVKEKDGFQEQTKENAFALTAGYDKNVIENLPKDAVNSSFGCGNPLAFAEIKQGETILDLGSGAGIDLIIAAEKTGVTGKVLGVDMTDEMIERAKKNIEKSGYNNIEVKKGIIEQLPIESNSVDWVISNCVINLSPEKDRVFKEIYRVLKPGGKILISDVMAENLPPFILAQASLYASCVSGAISEEQYLNGMKKAGLVSTKITERLVYDENQLASFVDADLTSFSSNSCCSGSPKNIQGIKKWIPLITGNIWSAKIYAEKPILS